MNIAGRKWALSVSPEGLLFSGKSADLSLSAPELLMLKVHRRWFVWRLSDGSGLRARLRGLTRLTAEALRREIRAAALDGPFGAIDSWVEDVDTTLQHYRREQRWLPREELAWLESSRPSAGLRDELERSAVWNQLEEQELATLAALDRDLAAEVDSLNDSVAKNELRDRKSFFDTIERTPLTMEQAEAVICFDNRVQVLAAAGSGKTSVMVARAAYAVARGFIRPERILLLAFNKAAADELQERVTERFAASGIGAGGVRASTFHAFGLDCIRQATGKQPSVARWVEQGQEQKKILEIVGELSRQDTTFRHAWEDYRLIYGQQRYPLGDEFPTDRDKENNRPGFLTARGEIVKSHGERQIADWLYLHGVDYEYERPYLHDTATTSRRQYRPDFYYPEIDAWHEHWAIGHDGLPVKEFEGYAEGMEWKRERHREHETDLIETTWSNLFRFGLGELEKQLVSRGVVLDRDVRRLTDVPGRMRYIKEQDLARTILTFMAHVKAAGLTREDIETKFVEADVGFAQGRAGVFLNVFWRVHERWESDLLAERSIDFNDMLLQAADHISSGHYAPPYDLILVDELQDTSRARAKLLQGLLNGSGRFFLGVGDDWQAINRFAGADISVMTEFDSWFGEGPQLALTKTFRCTQEICDVASEFVMKNPTQFDKAMKSAHGHSGVPIHIMGPPPEEDGRPPSRDRDSRTRRSVEYALSDLAGKVAAGELRPTKSARVTVDILGRYTFDRESAMPSRPPEVLDVNFRTVHGSKGLEADCIIVPGLVSDTYGFPSGVVDDPVLALAMPRPDDYPNAEERRLFYVAMTRARQRVILLTANENPSPFIFELLGESHGARIDVQFLDPGVGGQCHKCESGRLTWKDGKYGPFLSCSKYPKCDFLRSQSRKEDLSSVEKSGLQPTRRSGTGSQKTGRSAAAGAGRSSRSGTVITAQFGGSCTRCSAPVVRGQRIRSMPHGGWAHIDC